MTGTNCKQRMKQKGTNDATQACVCDGLQCQLTSLLQLLLGTSDNRNAIRGWTDTGFWQSDSTIAASKAADHKAYLGDIKVAHARPIMLSVPPAMLKSVPRHAVHTLSNPGLQPHTDNHSNCETGTYASIVISFYLI